jgi:hypothetical protein
MRPFVDVSAPEAMVLPIRLAGCGLSPVDWPHQRDALVGPLSPIPSAVVSRYVRCIPIAFDRKTTETGQFLLPTPSISINVPDQSINPFVSGFPENHAPITRLAIRFLQDANANMSMCLLRQPLLQL